MGRPSKLSPERRGKILGPIAAGDTRASAAAFAGISTSTLYDWLARGRAGETPFVTFAEEVEQAELLAEATIAAQWRSHFDKDWRSCAEYLSRRFPDRWRRDPIATATATAEVRVAPAVCPIDDSPEGLAGLLDAFSEIKGAHEILDPVREVLAQLDDPSTVE